MVSFGIRQYPPYKSLNLQNSFVPATLFAFAGSVLVLLTLLKTGFAWRIATDVPNDRSLHTQITPRVGGWGVTPVSALLIVIFAFPLWPIALLAFALGLVSQLDDRRGLPARVRFSAHLLGAAILVLVQPALYPWPVAIVAVVAIVWICNLYNFMDGANGIAGGMAVIGFGCFSAAAYSSHPAISIAAAIVAASSAGFLIFNFPLAKMFLGDAGSIPLGFLAGGLGYCGWTAGAWPFWFPVFVFSPFIADATVTLIKRLVRGEKFWQAHRQHYYQRMIGMAGAHAPVVLRWYAVMIAGILLALWALVLPDVWSVVVMACWTLFLVTLGLNVDRRWRYKPAY